MSASDNLQPRQFYHGSPWKITDQVEPTDQGHYARRAYFTTNWDTARAYAITPGRDKGYVYTVEPTGPATVDEYEKDSFKSEYPLRVTDVQEIPRRGV